MSKALVRFRSREPPCAPRFAAVLGGSGFPEPHSPFQSTRISIARAMKALAIDSATPPRSLAVRRATRFLTAPPGRERVAEQ
ncbi:hypothetical protein SAMN05216559_4043 [Halomicrobium zhouii]|uniref:Uncharacterized protein n=1 Tax=Halomicrobium zhouii TaxID=767519 RepID=A0A1I6M915_9EURY|nr:hypothetical protein SAMN05216559_4043 [Halomicrobium zhouii]